MIRGWCPTVHAPMPSGDGLLVRVKPFGGHLPAASLRALADAVTAYGNGVVELTGRGNLQVRGVHDAAGFARAAVAAGLADADPAREARRNVVAVPPCDDAVVTEAEALLADTAGLPAKFCVVVVGEAVFLDGERVSLRQALIATEFAKRGRFLLPPAGGEAGPMMTPMPVPPSAPIGQHLLYPPFGQIAAAALAHLADHTPAVRTTPWRAFLSPRPVPGWATTPGSIVACPGGPACASGTVPARADAARLLAAGFAGLHVSGCAKGCAHSGPATTLVGRDGRYDLVQQGRASDTPQHLGLTLDEAMAAL